MGKLYATCATCGHGRPLWIGSNGTREVSLPVSLMYRVRVNSAPQVPIRRSQKSALTSAPRWPQALQAKFGSRPDADLPESDILLACIQSQPPGDG